MDTQALRELIPATQQVTYFNTGWAGPSPAPVVARIHDAMLRESTTGPASIEGLRVAREANEEAQTEAAALFGCDPEEVILTHGTTEGVHIVLHGYPWQAGDEFVTCSLEHAAIATPTNVLEERHGVVAKRVELPPNATKQQMVDAFTKAITPRTKIVGISHVQYTCGLKLPVQEIAAAAHRNGALLLVDGAQTGGHLDLDVKSLGADFYAVSGQKWVLGPLGTGAMYIDSDDMRRIAPLFTTHAIADTRALRTEGAGGGHPLARFRVTSQSAALLAGFAEAIRLLRSVGFAELEAHAVGLATAMKKELASIPGCTVTGPSDPEASSGLVTVALEGWEPNLVVEQLWVRWQIGARMVNNPPAVRFSVAGFNTQADVDKALEAVRTLVQEKPAEIAATLS